MLKDILETHMEDRGERRLSRSFCVGVLVSGSTAVEEWCSRFKGGAWIQRWSLSSLWKGCPGEMTNKLAGV